MINLLSIQEILLKTADKLAEYKAFFEPKLENQGLKRSIEMAIKQITARVAFD